MKIGIDCYHIKDQKGIERYVLNLLNFWKKEKNINFILYVDRDESAKKIPQSKNFKRKILKGKISSTALFQHWLLPRQAKKDKVDILFSPSYLLPFFYKGKTALTIHDIIYEAHPEWFRFRGFWDKILVKWMGCKSAEKADIIFTPSEFTKKEIHKYYKIQFHKIIVTRLAADKVFYLKKRKENENFIKRKDGIKKNYFLFAAAIFERRCVTESILAFQEIAKKYSDFQYLIIGKDFTRAQNISAITKEINFKLKRQAIIYKPFFVENEKLAALYRGAYALVYLSIYEGFGLPIIESMRCGLPAIYGNAEALKETTGKNCFWVKNPQDIKEIYQMMKKAIEDKENYQKIKKQGIQKAQEFSWEKCAQDTLETLKYQINVK
ncbi:glycosyltransferase family 1 protein [bacterium]|nr:MAG: glycosyltransferase family 1 protein [bacterium]